jgi:hypothetical protein
VFLLLPARTREGIVVRSSFVRSAVVIGIAVAGAGAVAVPAYAGGPANVTMVCTDFGTALLPANAPPPKGGIITVVVNGQDITTHFVPGPCNAPGFVKVKGS